MHHAIAEMAVRRFPDRRGDRLADGLMRARVSLQKAFWAVAAAGAVYFALHKPAELPVHEPGSMSKPTPAGLKMPWPSTWDC
jgi:hypothetical protein